MLNTNENSLADKNVPPSPPPHPPPSSPSKKFSCSHYLVGNYILMPNLAVISINCYYYYTRHWIKNEYTLKSVCSYHVTYAFQNESTLYSCLNVKELLDRNRCTI